MPNFSTSLFDSFVINSSSNIFEHLSDSNISLSPGPPAAASSPLKQNNKEPPLNKKLKPKNNKILIINFQSVKNKKAEIGNLIDSSNPNIIIGTETWLRKDICSSEIFPDGFNVYRKDRRDGYGGVLVAVRSDYISEEVNPDNENDTESIFVKISLHHNKSLIVGSMYRPPSSDLAYMEDLKQQVDKLKKKNKGAVFWIGGDINLPDIQWTTQTVDNHHYPTSVNMKFLDLIHDNHLEQIVSFPTRKDRVLDLFLTNRPSLVNRCEPLPGISDHDIVYIDTDITAKINKPTQRKIYLWKKADNTKLEELTRSMNTNFHSIFHPMSPIQEMWDFIKKNLLNILQESVPSKLSSTRFHQAWITRDIKRLSRRKKRSFIKARNTNNKADIKRYQRLKKLTEKECKTAYKNYIEDMISPELTNNPKRFWSFIKSKRCETTGVAPLRDTDGLTYSDGKSKANILNQQFSSVFNSDEDVSTIPDKGPSPHPAMDNITVTENGVCKLLRNLNIHKASGPDEIPTRLIKEQAENLAPIFTTFFQASITQGKLPSDWKEANVVPIFKKGEKCKAANYRPVSLTVVICKILEHIICSSISKHLEKHGILTDAQHGFRKNRSCESQLILTVQDLAKSMDLGKQTDLILLDFSKAFDKVPHERLLYKAMYYGVRGSTLQWIRDFLSGRNQRVIVDGKSSNNAPVQSGVPQGSVLGPLMFLLFINDLPEYVHQSNVRLFADDCVLYRNICNNTDTIKLQEDLNSLLQWETDWQMEFHPSKCQLLRVTNKRKPVTNSYNIRGHRLEVVDSAKYLGVTIHKNLRWNEHIDNITKKANSTRAFIQRNLQHCPRNTKAACYTTLVRPLVEYACTVWDPHTALNIQKLEAVQRRSARFVMNNYSQTSSVTSMLEILQWTSLEERRARNKAIMMYRIVHGLVAIPTTELHPTMTSARGHTNRFLIPYARTLLYKHSFFPDSIRIWNNLPQRAVDSTSLDEFRQEVLACSLR